MRNRSLFFLGQHLCAISCATLFCIVAVLFGGIPTYAAHAMTIQDYPQVLIAVDATLPSCLITRSKMNPISHTLTSTTYAHCAPGTVIETATIPLSQARMRHEAYVMQLQAHASHNQQVQWVGQIQQLIKAKRLFLQLPKAMHPLSCYDGGQVVHVNSGYENIYNDDINLNVVYYVSRDCSTITIDTADVSAGYVPYDNTVIWDEFAYSYYQNSCYPTYFQLYPNQSYYTHPDATDARGLDALYHFGYDGSACNIAGPYAKFMSINNLT